MGKGVFFLNPVGRSAGEAFDGPLFGNIDPPEIVILKWILWRKMVKNGKKMLDIFGGRITLENWKNVVPPILISGPASDEPAHCKR